MEDSQIIELFWQRNQQAVSESNAKYGIYCTAIARNILSDQRDVEEAVSDTWLGAWQSIPPQKPNILRVFFGRITRNLALNRYAMGQTHKRGSGELTLALEELHEALPSSASAEDAVTADALEAAIKAFLHSLPSQECNVFLRRYWFMDSVKTIAEHYGMTEAHVRTLLHRTRGKLRVHLEQEGWLV